MNRPLPPEQHAPHCESPAYEWQAVIWPGTPVRGRCIHCGAIRVDRSTQTRGRIPEWVTPQRTEWDDAPKRNRTRRGGAA